MSVAKTSTCGAASAIVTPITPAPVPTSATRTARPSMRASAASTSASVVARGVNTRPGAVRKSSPWKVVSVRIGSWRIGMLITGARRNGTGTVETRLPDAADADARQRQLTRMGNAAAGAGLSLLMQGNTAEAREWFDRACERYRESWADAPPGSWGRPIGDPQGAHPRAATGPAPSATRAGRSSRVPTMPATPIGRYAAALAHAVLREWDDAADRRRCSASGRELPGDVADALAALVVTRSDRVHRRPSSPCSSRSRRATPTSRIFPPRTPCSCCRRSPSGAGSRRPSSSRRSCPRRFGFSSSRPSAPTTSRFTGRSCSRKRRIAAKTQRIATMIPTTMKKVSHIYSVDEVGGRRS